MRLGVLLLLAIALSASAAKRKECNPKKDSSCCRAPRRASYPATRRAPPPTLFPFFSAGNRKSKCSKKVEKKPTKCSKKGFRGSCRSSCDEHWDDLSIDICTDEPTSEPKTKEFLAMMGGRARPKKPPVGSVDWTTGVPCVCDTHEDNAEPEHEYLTGLCQKTLPEDDGRGNKIKRCRSLHVDAGTTPPQNRCASDWEYCTAHPPSPPPRPPP